MSTALDALSMLGVRVVWLEDYNADGEIVVSIEDDLPTVALVDTRITPEEALRQVLAMPEVRR